jgi:serine acetyltransferase
MSGRLVPSDRAPGLLIAPGVVLPSDALIAPYVTIHEGVLLGAGVTESSSSIAAVARRVALSANPRSSAIDVASAAARS